MTRSDTQEMIVDYVRRQVEQLDDNRKHAQLIVDFDDGGVCRIQVTNKRNRRDFMNGMIRKG